MALQIGEQIHRESSPPILSVPDGEPTKEVWTDILLSVEHLEVTPPPDRPDDLCPIYGYLRVSDEENCAAPVTLFDRTRNNPETIDLGDPRSRFLPLSDDHDGSARPIIGGSIFYVQIKLWEKIEDDTQEDPVIVDVDIKFDDFYETNKRTFLSGFVFSMAYAHILGGVCAEVRFTVIKDIASAGAEEVKAQPQITGKRNHRVGRMLVYGSIGATQGINEDEVPVIQMFHAPSSDPLLVNIGSPIPLQRKLLVALTGGGCLGISYSLVNAANDLKLVGSVPFCFERDDRFLLTVPENLTYTQESRDGLVSVSLTFVPYKYPPR